MVLIILGHYTKFVVDGTKKLIIMNKHKNDEPTYHPTKRTIIFTYPYLPY